MPDKSNRFRDLQIACAILGTNISALSREWGVSDTWIKTVAEGRGKSGNVDQRIEETISEAASLLPSSFLQSASNVVADSVIHDNANPSQVDIIRQLHHQIKFNLSQISEIIAEEIEGLGGNHEDVVTVLKDISNRIDLISNIHDQLARQDAPVESLRIDNVLKTVLTQVRQVYADEIVQGNWSFDLQCDQIELPPKVATHCAMLIHEVISSAIRENGRRQEDDDMLRILLEQTSPDNVKGRISGMPVTYSTVESDKGSFTNKLVQHFLGELDADYSSLDGKNIGLQFSFPIK